MPATGAAARAAPHPDSSSPSPTTSLPGGETSLVAFWQRYAFSLGQVDFLNVDVALGAMVFGEWARFERRLAEGLACEAHASAEGLLLPQAEIDEAAVAFRYERDLISAADMAAWLDRNDVSTEAWMASVARGVLRQKWCDDLEELLDRYGPSPRQLEAAAVAEGICSGLFDEFEQSFSGKAAIAFESDRRPFDPGMPASASHAGAMRFARRHAHWLGGRESADTLSRLRLILEIQDRFRAAAEKVTNEAALLEVIEANRLEWVVVETDTLSFAEESAAREAMLCVTEDRLSLADVSSLSRHPLIRARGVLADVPAEHRHRILAAEPGQVIGPLLVDGRFHVTIVTGREGPTPSNPDVAQRARTVLLDQMTRRAARDHVKRRPASHPSQ